MTQRTLAGNTPPATCPSWLAARHIIIMQKCETQQQKKKERKSWLNKHFAELNFRNIIRYLWLQLCLPVAGTRTRHTHTHAHTHSLEVKRAQWGALNPQQADRQAGEQAGRRQLPQRSASWHATHLSSPPIEQRHGEGDSSRVNEIQRERQRKS